MSNCPSCNHPNAYIGFTDIDCGNPNCRHFSAERIGGVVVSTPHGYVSAYAYEEIPVDAPITSVHPYRSEVRVAPDKESIAGFCVHFSWYTSMRDVENGYAQYLETLKRSR
jgi:hypothetical protein